MRKNIDIDEATLTKLKVLSVFENMSVKSLMENAVRFFVAHKEEKKIQNMTTEQKEGLGLLLLMQQVDRTDIVSEDEVMKTLNKIQ